MFTNDQLDSILRSAGGSFEQVPFALVLRALYEARRTCVLEIRRRQLFKRIGFEDGMPRACESNLAHERFGRFLVGIGRLDEPTHAQALSESITRSVPLGEVLLERKILDSAELYRLLQQNLAKQLLDGFTWGDGEYAIFDERLEVHAPLKVRVPQLIVTGVTRFAPQRQIDAWVMTLIGEPLRMHPSPAIGRGELHLSAEQDRLLDAFDRPLSLSEIAERTGSSIDQVSRQVFAFVTLGLILRASEEVAPAQPETRREVGSTVELASAERASVEELAELFLRHRRLDLFEVLGVAEQVQSGALDEAFLNYVSKIGPWLFDEQAPASVQEQAKELFLRGAFAYGELADLGRRREIALQRQLRREQLARASQGPGRIHTDLLDPEAQYKKGIALRDEGDLRGAITTLEFASDCDPQNGLYRAELLHCRFLANPKSARGILDDLLETHRIDPRCGLAYYYAGELAGHLGDLEVAERELRQAIRRMAPDRRPIELLKELLGSGR